MGLSSWWRRLRGRAAPAQEAPPTRGEGRRAEDATGVVRVTPETPTVALESAGSPQTVAVAAAGAAAAPAATRAEDVPGASERRVVGVLVAVEGEFRGSAWALCEGPNRLGREYGCEICLPTERLAPRHASIELRGGRFHVEMLADEELRLGGELARSGVLRDGATLGVGMTIFRFRSIVDT